MFSYASVQLSFVKLNFNFIHPAVSHHFHYLGLLCSVIFLIAVYFSLTSLLRIIGRV